SLASSCTEAPAQVFTDVLTGSVRMLAISATEILQGRNEKMRAHYILVDI
ncbi:hypothetical protein PanWU01x14_183750, partial [Parasponia andersonii]